MFKNLLDFWRKKDFLTDVLREFEDMLRESQEMFKMVCQNLLEGKDIPGLEEKIYNLDKRINRLEIDIRKKIIEHLSIQPSVDTPMCLLLMSVVKDAERLGDYAKNLYQIKYITEQPLDRKLFIRLFDRMDETILGMFCSAKKAFIESDEEVSKSLWQTEREVVKRCDAIIGDIAKSNLRTNQAVIFTLIARYFKRTAAHLTNIATSVIVPISELDFFDEKRRAENNKR